MKAFRKGRRNFKPDEIVYVIDDSLDCQCDISDIGDIILYGKVSSYCGYGEYYIDLYTPIESIFTDCLITFLDDDSIRKAFREGFLIPRSSIKDWKKLHPNMPTGIHVHKDKIFYTSNEALDEINRQKEIAEKIKERHSHMTEEEICMEEDTDYLKRRGLSKSEIKKYVSLVKTADYLPEIYDLLIRVHGDEVQWKDESGWKTLMELNRPKKVEEVHTEKYYINVYHICDADKKPILIGYTNLSPESIFEMYGDPREYVMNIANKQWKIEDALTTPIRYKNEITRNENGEFVPLFVTQYQIEKGTFEIANGKLRNFDISIDSKHSINQFWISVLSNTSLNDQEIREWFSKKIKNMVGDFFELFQEEIEKLEIRKDF